MLRTNSHTSISLRKFISPHGKRDQSSLRLEAFSTASAAGLTVNFKLSVRNYLHTYAAPSFDLKQDLECLVENEQLDFSRIRMFTADAVSMYTNIDTDHARQTISVYLRQNHFVLPQGTLVEALINGLNIVMRNNYFRFLATHTGSN